MKWELLELYKTVTNMGDLWDHSLPDSEEIARMG
jgi:hypothetical protein